MKTKITLLTMVLLLCFKSTFADPITRKKATIVASKWINNPSQKSKKRTQKEIDFIKEVSHNNRIVYYIINFKRGGFVVVSADDATKPILAYSDTSSFDTTLENPTTKLLLESYESYVYNSALDQKSSRVKSVHSGWNTVLSAKSKKKSKSRIITPFMDDIFFTQSSGFERFCPSDEDGQAIVGCVATAISQVMRYWEFPTTGRGETSYNHSIYGNLSVNFENQQYDWDNMSKTRADDENAKLSYHTGVAVRMNYGISANGGSGAYTRDALAALKRNFKYNSGARMVYRVNYSDLQWGNTIKEQLNEKRPVLYSGRSENLEDPEAKGAGHLFALDGYDITDQGDFFHINWGWGGRSNGYFSLTEMITHNGKYNWIDNNAIIINLFPTNVAPVFASEPVTSARIGDQYEYAVSVTDENRKDVIEVSLVDAPSWLTVQSENGIFTLQGIPSESDAGSQKIVVAATDGFNSAMHEFDLVILRNNEVIDTSIIDFETNDFSQANFSDNETFPFSINNIDNHFSQSANIIDNQESVISLTQNFYANTSINFDYKVSSERRYDFLIFRIDGKVIDTWSGQQDWATASFNISSGEHTLSWSYKKDGSVSEGLDAAMIDNIIYKGVVMDQEAPSIPSGLAVSDSTETSLLLGWNAASDNAKVKGYEVYQDGIKITTVNSLAYTVSGLEAKTEYSFSVRAVDYADNVSEQSNTVSGTTKELIPLNRVKAIGDQDSFDFQIFPNPSSDVIHITSGKTLEKGYYQIMDTHGRVIEQKNFAPSITIQKLQTGMYFLYVFDQGNVYSTSFIKSGN